MFVFKVRPLQATVVDSLLTENGVRSSDLKAAVTSKNFSRVMFCDGVIFFVLYTPCKM